ncbi:MAG: hypothetical protein PHC34_11315 [Candidatus Gastranaerophilales bacterium]|nr:hypothetical protein [Candidatus Gastranaerophilales bacterium]
MNDNNITRNKTIESIFKRIRFRTDRYPRTVIFDYSPESDNKLQEDFVTLEEGEHPIFESYNRNGYTLLTTHYLYSVILRNEESPLLEKNQKFKVKIEDLIYFKSLNDIITEKEKRTEYQEIALKFIETTKEDGGILFYLRIGTEEFMFHEILRQLVSMNNFCKNQEK